MPAKVNSGTIVFREWAGESGLSETEGTFATLDELFALCLDLGDPRLVDRIILNGYDEEGKTRSVTFSFQSVTH